MMQEYKSLWVFFNVIFSDSSFQRDGGDCFSDGLILYSETLNIVLSFKLGSYLFDAVVRPMDSACAWIPSLVTVLGNLFTEVSHVYICIYISLKMYNYCVSLPKMQYNADVDKFIGTDTHI